MSKKTFTEEQKQYIAGFAYGADVARAINQLPILSNSARSDAPELAPHSPASAGSNGAGSNDAAVPQGPEDAARAAQSSVLEQGGKLTNEEQAKRSKNPLDMWDEIQQRANRQEFPKGSDVFLTKFHGLFFVAPAQNAYMCRLRIPGGELYAHQLEGLAELSESYAGGYLDLTTRANLQLREIEAGDAMNILYGLRDLDIINLGAGGDNIRNVTASPLSGIDSEELIETLPVAKRMHHYILNHREMYGLPRKFNIAFDGGGRISSLDDTNDIGFHAVRVSPAAADDSLPEGVYFLLTLGGITGHKDFARSTGILVTAEETLDVAAAIIRVFVRSGDRTDRKKARLKYVLDDWGFDKFLAEVEQELGSPLRRVDEDRWTRNDKEDRVAHVGVHAQRQSDRSYVGVVFPVGRCTTKQARGLSAIARQFGSGRLRLTVWQNLLIPDIANQDLESVKQAIRKLGLDYSATSVRAGLIACTGNAGCKFAGADTKKNALQIAAIVEKTLQLDTPVNIHVTGCHHSCAQHYIGDIGLIATQVEVGDDLVEGYDLYVGGGWGRNQAIGRLVRESIPADEAPPAILGLLTAFLDQRHSANELFSSFSSRMSDADLREFTLVPNAISVG